MKKIMSVLFLLAIGTVSTLSILKLFRLVDSTSPSLPTQITISSICGGLVALLFIFKSPLLQHIRNERHLSLILVSLIVCINLLFCQNSILNIDRSRSFYVLSWVKNGDVYLGANGALRLDVKSSEALNLVAISDRLKEQLQRGLVELDFEKYELSLAGNFVYEAATLFSRVFNLKSWEKNAF
jgi:hypothetical protein